MSRLGLHTRRAACSSATKVEAVAYVSLSALFSVAPEHENADPPHDYTRAESDARFSGGHPARGVCDELHAFGVHSDPEDIEVQYVLLSDVFGQSLCDHTFRLRNSLGCTLSDAHTRQG